MRVRTTVVVCLLALAGLAGAEEARPPFPAINVSDRKGTVQPLPTLYGSATVLNFWATWCGPCRVELPELEKLQAELGRRGLEVLAVNVDGAPPLVDGFVQRTGLGLPVYFLDGHTQRALGIDSIPMTVLLDREGRVVRYYQGYSVSGMADLRQQVERLLPAGQGGK